SFTVICNVSLKAYIENAIPAITPTTIPKIGTQLPCHSEIHSHKGDSGIKGIFAAHPASTFIKKPATEPIAAAMTIKTILSHHVKPNSVLLPIPFSPSFYQTYLFIF